MHRLDGLCGGCVCGGGAEAEGGEVQAVGAADVGALRARPRRGDWRVSSLSLVSLFFYLVFVTISRVPNYSIAKTI